MGVHTKRGIDPLLRMDALWTVWKIFLETCKDNKIIITIIRKLTINPFYIYIYKGYSSKLTVAFDVSMQRTIFDSFKHFN